MSLSSDIKIVTSDIIHVIRKQETKGQIGAVILGSTKPVLLDDDIA